MTDSGIKIKFPSIVFEHVHASGEYGGSATGMGFKCGACGRPLNPNGRLNGEDIIVHSGYDDGCAQAKIAFRPTFTEDGAFKLLVLN